VTNARSSITDTAQTAAEKAAGAVGTLLNNETVGAAIDKADAVYRKNPLLSKVGIALTVVAVAAVIVRLVRR